MKRRSLADRKNEGFLGDYGAVWMLNVDVARCDVCGRKWAVGTPKLCVCTEPLASDEDLGEAL